MQAPIESVLKPLDDAKRHIKVLFHEPTDYLKAVEARIRAEEEAALARIPVWRRNLLIALGTSLDAIARPFQRLRQDARALRQMRRDRNAAATAERGRLP